MSPRGIIPSTSFARREVVAPAGLWERGAGGSGIIPPSARLLPPGRASKAFATSPTGETSLSTSVVFAEGAAAKPSPLDGTASSVSPPAKRNASVGKYGLNSNPREITRQEINQTLIGREVDRDTYLDGRIRERQLREQSDRIIERLEGMGIQGRTTRGQTCVVGLVSGQAEMATDYRNCNIIPVQQSRNVHDMLKHVRYLVDNSRSGQLRMLVVSAGWCPLDRYRKNHKDHTRRMSKFAAHPKLKKFGIEVQFYNVENTIHRTDDGVAMMNLHSHVLFRSTRFLGKKKWVQFLEFARNYFPKGYVHDSKVQKANEVVKYVFKPSEFNLLTDQEFANLFYQVSGGRCQIDPETGEVKTRLGEDGELIEVREGPLKFFHPLGVFREFRSKLKRNNQKLIQVPTEDGRWNWRVTERMERQERPDSEDCERPNMVLAITRPMPKFTRRMEPCVIVQDYTGDFSRMVSANGLEATVNDARAIFEKRVAQDQQVARAVSSMKHTTTTTVPEWSEAERAKHHPPPLVSPEPLPQGRLH